MSSANLSNRKNMGVLEFDEQVGEGEDMKSEKLAGATS